MPKKEKNVFCELCRINISSQYLQVPYKPELENENDTAGQRQNQQNPGILSLSLTLSIQYITFLSKSQEYLK